MSHLLLLIACAGEFGLSSKPAEPPANLDSADSGAPQDSETTDSTPPTDSTPITDTDVPEDTAPPVDTAPVEEPPADDCTDTSDLVYVISRDDGTLYLFDPPSLQFTALSQPQCNSWETPSSMAVSRDGHAYVRYFDNEVFDVNLSTYRCSSTTYSDRRTGFGSFGMGYATNSANTWQDQLYIANSDRLAMLDTTTWAVTDLGALPSQSELTGNSAGELWAILPLEHPAKLVQLDKNNGRTLATINMVGFPNAQDIDTFAFATWGGDFWLFIRESGMGNHTDVYQVDSSGNLSKRITNIGFDVVGAGVSTCAPN